MDALFDNLYLYELVLLFLGAFLFLILSAALVYMIIKHQNIKKLLLFFIIPIIMIGYPSIQEVQIENGKLAFTKVKEEVQNNPADSLAIEKLKSLIAELEARATNPKDVAEISEAYLLVGKPDKAISVIDGAINNNKTLDKEQLKTLNNFKKIGELEKDIQANKISPKDRKQIKKRLSNINLSDERTKRYLKKKYTLPENFSVKSLKGNTIEK